MLISDGGHSLTISGGTMTLPPLTIGPAGWSWWEFSSTGRPQVPHFCFRKIVPLPPDSSASVFTLWMQLQWRELPDFSPGGGCDMHSFPNCPFLPLLYCISLSGQLLGSTSKLTRPRSLEKSLTFCSEDSGIWVPLHYSLAGCCQTYIYTSCLNIPVPSNL